MNIVYSNGFYYISSNQTWRYKYQNNQNAIDCAIKLRKSWQHDPKMEDIDLKSNNWLKGDEVAKAA
jgi:hypothetical protein